MSSNLVDTPKTSNQLGMDSTTSVPSSNDFLAVYGKYQGCGWKTPLVSCVKYEKPVGLGLKDESSFVFK